MTMFPKGVLEEMVGVYGIFYDLRLRLPDGQLLPIFYDNLMIKGPSLDNDYLRDNDPISALLVLEKSYELLLIIDARKVKYSPQVPPETVFKLVTKVFPAKPGGREIRRNNVLQGKVLDLSWNPGSEQYQAVAFPEIYDYRYVLVETAIGKAILSREDLKEDLGEEMVEQIAVGGYLEWSPARLDILAIL